MLTVGTEAMVSVYRGANGTTTGDQQLLSLVALTEIALTVGTAGSLLVADRVHRQTLGLEPAVIARHYQHHQAMLHAVREGLIITDQVGKLMLVNDEARRLLRLPLGDEGTPLGDLLPT
jgi:sensor histidine kinase regulating citrate/malate metabolism